MKKEMRIEKKEFEIEKMGIVLNTVLPIIALDRITEKLNSRFYAVCNKDYYIPLKEKIAKMEKRHNEKNII